MPPWTHVILEAYCTRLLNNKKDRHVYELVDAKTLKFKRRPNPVYGPAYKMARKPSYCLGIPQYKCLEKDCPHFGYANAEEKDYLFLNKKYKPKK